MQTFSKKFLAILLTLCMLASFAPMVAFAAEAEVVGQQLMLGDDLTMHFYVKTEAANATAIIQVSGVQRASYNLAGLTAGENGYDLSVDLAAAEMTEDITLTVNDGTGDILAKTYSVQDYAHYLLENNYTDETKALAKEMLNYGAKAQAYFGHKTGDLANAGYEMETSAVIGTEVPGVEIADTLSGVDYYGASMVFKSKIAVRFYFTGSSEGLSFSHGTPVQKGDRFYIEVADINPDQMDTALNVSVAGNGGEISFSYSPMAYIIRMYNKQNTSSGLKALLAAANGYFQAAKVFTGVAENRTGSLSLACRYGTNNLIQVNTNIPSDTPCVNFTAGDNGCSIDQSANQYQQFGWVGMDNVDGTIVLTFHFNGAFEAGQTYFLPKGAVFGFTDNSKYTLDKNYTFSFDGNGWSMTAEEPAINLTYRYGTADLIQFNTDLPSDTPCVNFTAGDNGCNIDQSANQYQQVGWIGMVNADGTIVLTFNFNAGFEVGQSYTLSAGSLFGFTDGSKYELAEDITLYWTGSEWSAEAPVVETPVLNFLACSYGTSTLIQLKTDLPSSTPCVNFTAGQNGCEIDQSGNQYQQVGWIGMAQDDAGNIYLAFSFNSAFEAGQTYVLPKGAVFGFTDGSKYVLKENYTFTFNGNSWDISTPEDPITMAYRWGNNNTIQYNTNLPTETPCANFLAGDNGCALIQNGQQVGWVGMENVDGTIVLTFHFNSTFEVGQSYTLSAGSVFGFTDGSLYELYEDITLYWDGSVWSAEAPVVEEKTVALTYRWGNNNTIQYNTDLPATTALKDFLASDNGCQITQGGEQQVGYISMANADGIIVLTFNFNAAFTAGQSYSLAAGSVFGFTDGTSYTLSEDMILYWDGATWGNVAPITLTYRWGNNNTIQFNTNLPSETPCANFLAGDNGCALIQNGQQVGWVGMENVDGTIVLTFHFNSAYTYGQSYTLSAGSVFGFTDGSSYKIYQDVLLYWDGNGWTAEEPAPETDVLDEGNFTGGKVITFADVPADFTNPDKIAEYKELGFNTSLVTEDHIGSWGEGADRYYSVSMNTANAPANSLNFAYRWGNSNTIQVNTNLPASTPLANFTADQNGCSIDQTGNAVQWVGWIGMADADGTIVLTFNFNKAFEVGQSYVLPKGAVFGFTDGNTYTLDADYTFTWDGSNWSMDASTLSFSVNYANGNTIQLKTNIPTGLTYGNFLLNEAADKGHNLLLETNAQEVGWFGFSADANTNAVYFTLNFNSYNKPGAQYILKAGTSLKAGDRIFTTDRDYILTVNNAYLSSIENLDNAGLDVWVRNFNNKTGYFDDAMTKALLLYKDTIDGFYMVDEAFQNNALLVKAGQESITTDFDALSADVVGWFNTNFAGKYFHSNHVPISSFDHYGDALTAANADAYRQFLEIYKDKFNEMVDASGSSIGFDNYPFVRSQTIMNSGIYKDYLLNALIAAQVAGNYDLSVCVQTFEASGKMEFMGFNTSRDITSAAEVSLQLYTGFAMGADVFEYFAYNSTEDFKAIMNQDGSKRIYDLVKEGNNALCFADVVNSFTWNGIVTSAGSVNSHNGDAFNSVADLVLTNASNGVLDSYASTDDAVIGCFTKDSLNGYMLVNYNDPAAVTGNNSVTVTFANCTRARVYTEVDGTLSSQIVDLTNGSYTAILAPGAGCFIIPA